MDLASKKAPGIRSTPHVETTLQTCGGLTNGSTVEDQRMPRYDCLLPTFHLTGRDVQLVRNKSRQTSDQAAQEVHIPVKKGVCADKQDDYKSEGSV
jgi:hypothetical protein